LVSGASGSGKTIAAKVIVEELLQEHVPVVVFDYTKQWERLARPFGVSSTANSNWPKPTLSRAANPLIKEQH